jgi:hypothetical protein
MNKFILTALLPLLGLSTQMVAQQAPDQIIEKFFDDYQTNDPGAVLDSLYTHMPTADDIAEDIARLKSQFVGLKDVVGAYRGYELITEKSIADKFNVYSYLVRYERQPVRFVFVFYKPAERWGLFSFSYDDNLLMELEQSVRLEQKK